MPSGITPWSGGPRSPLTYNLRPGQVRNTRVNVFPSQTIINNNIGNFGNYGYYDDCCGGGNKMGWFGWTMLGGMSLSFLGNLFSGIFGGGGCKPDGAGDTPTPEKPLDLKSIKEDAKIYSSQFDVKIDVLSDGTLLCNKEKYKDFDELEDALRKSPNPVVTSDNVERTEKKEKEVTPTDENPADGINKKSDFDKLFNEAYMNGKYDPTKGLKVGDTYYKTPADAFKAYSSNDVVKPENANDLNSILKDIQGIYDDGKDNSGKEISDFRTAKATLTNGKTYKNGDTVKIGNHEYQIEIKEGYLCFVDKNPRGGNSNKQLYMLEKAGNGQYQLHQRPDIIYNDGVGKIAH